MSIQIGNLVKVKDLSAFKQTEGEEELLQEVFEVVDIDEGGYIHVMDSYEYVLDDIFSEEELEIVKELQNDRSYNYI